jgi:uncharacterized protein YdeI (YjbR/CyaY-like superfamily)
VADPVELLLADATSWRTWLAQHSDETGGASLVLAKKGTTSPTTLTYDEALEEALCFGWIDGQKGALDDQFWRQRFTPRGPASRWSKINVEKAEALIAAGTMTAAGLREVERAKADGRWAAAYAGQARSEVPDDLRAALEADEEARAFFEVISSANRYAILYRISSVKKAETRARKIAEYVAMLARHETIHPQ